MATAAEVAWLALVPCALVTVAAMLVLGPAVGGLLPHAQVTPWPSALKYFHPEPAEHGHYLVMLVGPLLLAGAIVLAARRPLELPAAAFRLVPVVQALGAAFVVACLVSQRRATFGALYTEAARTSHRTVYFTVATLVAACLIAVALAAGVRDPRVRGLARRLLRESPRRRAVVLGLAVLAIAVSVLPAVNVEHTIMRTPVATHYHVMFPLDEAYAVLGGRSPLVDFAAQYGSLWAYVLAGGMHVLGDSVGSFTILSALLTGLALLAVFATLRRVLPTAAAALALFLPLLATSFYVMQGTAANRYSLVTLLGAFPLRLAGPCFLLWLTARQLDGAPPRSRVPLFAAAGLVILNNGDFGIPALGATVAALVWAGRPSVRGLARLAAEAAVGLCAAYAIVAVLTLARAGVLPDVSLLFRYARLFTGAGFGLLPVKPLIGVSTIVYLTYVAAIAVATVRAVGSASDRLLTGLLAWSGVFGLGIGAYYVGRSHPEVLTNMFPAWALALTLLFALVVRRLLQQPSRLPTLAEAACLVGFGVLVCSLAQTPTPWAQASRLGDTTTRTYSPPGAERFLAERTRDGEPVAVFSMLGHRLAVRAGVDDVTPYTGEDSMPTREQFAETLTLLRRAGGHKLFVPIAEAWPELHEAVEAGGFHVVAYDPRAELVEFSDER
jgi:hypothetical protein